MANNTDTNAIIVALLTSILAIFVVVNLPQQFNIGVAYTILAFFSVLVFLAIKGNTPGVEFKPRGNLFRDVFFWGVLPGIAWIILALTLIKSPFTVLFSVAVPATFAVSPFGAFVSFSFAPVIETLALEGAMRRLFRNFRFRAILITLIVAITFAGFHLIAFTSGGYSAATSPFIAAVAFSLSAGFILARSNNLLSVMVYHTIVNAFVIFVVLST